MCYLFFAKNKSSDSNWSEWTIDAFGRQIPEVVRPQRQYDIPFQVYLYIKNIMVNNSFGLGQDLIKKYCDETLNGHHKVLITCLILAFHWLKFLMTQNFKLRCWHLVRHKQTLPDIST